jgi:putative spermidine/putrescine transport system ATP-binding protein
MSASASNNAALQRLNASARRPRCWNASVLPIWPTACLSGGQKQRVALARALVIEPPLLMFDEPLSNLDAKLRVDMRVEIRQLQRANGTTSVYVTHDQEEAFSISDRVAIMNQGRIMQLDTPETLYQRPANAFVARFVGFENLIAMKVAARDGARVTAAMADGATLDLSQERFGAIPDAFVLATRPDGLQVSTDPSAAGIPATLGLRTYLGRAYQYQCETGAGHLIANGALSAPREVGETARLVPVPEQCTILAPE